MPLTTTTTTTMDLGWISRSYPSSLLLKSETEAKTEKGGRVQEGWISTAAFAGAVN